MPNTVTLKLNGKAFTCTGLKSGKKCRSRLFEIAGYQSDIAGPEQVVYHCAQCKNLVQDKHFEPQLPPRNDWRTPGDLFAALHREYHFNLDAAADAQNTKCPSYFDGAEGRDALKRPWRLVLRDDTRAFCNPPYSPVGTVETWLQKGLEQAALGVISVFLVPMASSVGWFNDLVVPFAEWHTFRGRIQFEDPLASNDAALASNDAARTSARTNPKQDNLLVIYNPKSTTIGHAAVRDAKTGRRLWTRPDLLQ